MTDIDPEVGHNELGSIQCKNGWIDMIEVMDEEPLNARGCGISSVLLELCMIDPEVNFLYHPFQRYPSEAIKKLERFPDVLQDIVEYCKCLIGLRNTANPKSAAFGYFEVANSRGYRRMMVQSFSRQGQDPNTPPTHIHKYWTEDAQKKFDKRTGNIRLDESCDQGCQGKTCKAWEEIWYFCKDV